ncbi:MULTISPECIES: hypothetical protein [unclassified Actinoplanes]|uniref:hypothetical protein n=1 Tax=unclassified Actinoplanes TaxID=2626549 RepID=UPI0012BAE984|nr:MULTISPECIES: hypothetical protein [unclassified Actinoplanes]
MSVTVFVAGLGITALVIMLLIAGGAADAGQAKLQIEALKYGLGFSATAGAVAALLLGSHRQVLAEHHCHGCCGARVEPHRTYTVIARRCRRRSDRGLNSSAGGAASLPRSSFSSRSVRVVFAWAGSA